MTETLAVEHGRLALAADVEIVRRRDSLLLFAAASGRSVRISAVATCLLPLLAAGADFESLRARLQQEHPAATDVAGKLGAFLAALGKAGVLHGAGPSRPAGGDPKFRLFDPDPLARVLAWPLRKGLPGWYGGAVALLLMVAAVAAIALLADSGGLPRLPDMVQDLDWRGVLVFALLVVPLHEGAHAIACRVAGAEVSGAGIILHGRVVPGPYVDTSQAYRIGSRLRRLTIPAAGPFVNLVAAGSVSAWLLYGQPSAASVPVLHGLLLVCLLFVYLDTNPFTPSDGSHCIEALLDDELARRYAFSRVRAQAADLGVIRRYRLIASGHLLLSAALFGWWWQ